MKKTAFTLFHRLLSAAILCLVLSSWPVTALAQEEKVLRILCSTFPVYQMTRIVVQGRQTAQVSLMLPADLGCPHDYVLTPRDMQLLAQADVLVLNGLGLEDFLERQLLTMTPPKAIIDSSQASTELIAIDEETTQANGKHGAHHDRGYNPHLFTSPRLVNKMTTYIASELAAIDPHGADTYRRNAENYGTRLTTLGLRVLTIAERLASRRIITQHGVFAYLARDMGLEVVAVIEPHPGQEPAAAELLALIKTAREAKVGAIFSEPQYPARVVRTIAKEVGIPAATLDPVASGPENAPLDYFETIMVRNLDTLQASLGSR